MTAIDRFAIACAIVKDNYRAWRDAQNVVARHISLHYSRVKTLQLKRLFLIILVARTKTKADPVIIVLCSVGIIFHFHTNYHNITFFAAVLHNIRGRTVGCTSYLWLSTSLNFTGIVLN